MKGPSPAIPAIRGRSLPALLLTLLTPAPALAQGRFEELGRKSYLPLLHEDTLQILPADLDGDGDEDLVVVTETIQRIYRNAERGSYDDVTWTHMPNQPNDDVTTTAAVGDIDGDGDLDLLVGATGEFNVPDRNRLYVNDGQGRFTDETQSRLPLDTFSTEAIALGDVDGNGDLDAVFGNGTLEPRFGKSGEERNRLYINTGGAFFDATVDRMPDVLDNTVSVALGDVDGDGDLDLAVGNRPTEPGGPGAKNALYLNRGNGSFTDATETALPPLQPDTTHDVHFVDVEGDGDLDLLFGNRNIPDQLLVNDGSGVFTDETATRLPEATSKTFELATSDVDADGSLDLIVAKLHETTLYRNDGDGNFAPVIGAGIAPLTDARGAAFADVDGDGDPDILLASPRQERMDRLYLNDGSGNFSEPDVVRLADPLLHQTGASAVVDLDGDEKLDVVLSGRASPRQEVFVYRNTGGAVFEDVTSTSLPAGVTYSGAIEAGDVNGDGQDDLVLGRRLFLNQGGTFAEHVGGAFPLSSSFVGSARLLDAEGDGDLDYLVGTTTVIGTCPMDLLYLNDGSGTFTAAPAGSLPSTPQCTASLAAGDLDGDGDVDFVTAGRKGGGGQNRLYLNDGAGVFSDVTSPNFPIRIEFTNVVALGDVDGDGDLDVLCGNGASAQDRLYLNDGAAVFTDVTATTMPVSDDETSGIAVGDVDEDGDLDLMVSSILPSATSKDDTQTRLLLNDGTGTFTDATPENVPFGPIQDVRGVRLADLDGDGDLDALLAAEDPATLTGADRVFLNMHRQVSVPRYARVGGLLEVEVTSEPGYATAARLALAAFSVQRLDPPASTPWGPVHLGVPTRFLSPLTIPATSSTALFQIPIPPDPALAGRAFYVQGAVTGSTTPLRTTGMTSEVILD